MAAIILFLSSSLAHILIFCFNFRARDYMIIIYIYNLWFLLIKRAKYNKNHKEIRE